MSNPAPQPLAATTDPASTVESHDDPDVPEDNDYVSEAGSWDTESEISEEDEFSDDSLDNGSFDEEYSEDERAVTAWLARNPGGTPLLYPQLFIVKLQRGDVVTPPRDPNRPCFLARLPPEIRIRVYEYYFDGQEEVVRRKDEQHEPFLDRNGKEVRRIYLSSENVELKFWLSLALLQTSRQVRFEAMATLFENRVFTVEWLSLLPRFVGFLGKEGYAMVRYLDVWDELNLQGDDRDGYQAMIKSISHLSCLWHLRIVLAWTPLSKIHWSNRIRSWFDTSDWTHDGRLKEAAVPKMRHEALETYWPEYEVLKTLRAQKFTLAVVTFLENAYVEFDRNHGVYSELAKSIQSHPAPEDLTSPAPINATGSILPDFVEDFEIVRRYGSGMPPTWQDSDTLSNKTIPLYNFFRAFFHDHMYLQLPEERLREMKLHNFIHFPTALKSRGSIIRDCPFCYLVEHHCGYHNVPNQPPFEIDGVEKDAKTLQMSFEALSYVDMREATRAIVKYINKHTTLDNIIVKPLAVLTVYDYLGWHESAISKFIVRLDAAVEVGWIGKRVDKDEVPPWDILFCDLTCFCSNKRALSVSVPS
jgi:hypothetical protein